MNDAEKIYANDKVAAQRIREENEKRLSEAGKIGASMTNSIKTGCAQMDAGRNIEDKPRDRSTNTREQRAKMSGVSSGTIYRKTSYKLNTGYKEKATSNEVGSFYTYASFKWSSFFISPKIFFNSAYLFSMSFKVASASGRLKLIL